MSNLSNLQVPRITVGESYQKIFEDLETGVEVFTRFYYSPLFIEYNMAQVLKAKLLLNRGVMRGACTGLEKMRWIWCLL